MVVVGERVVGVKQPTACMIAVLITHNGARLIREDNAQTLLWEFDCLPASVPNIK